MSIFINRNNIDILFVDWFGVISTNYYWCIQYQKQKLLKEWCDSIFDDELILNDWMRGKYDLDFLSHFRVKIDKDLIIKYFVDDIKYYQPDNELLDSLNKLFPNAKKILVTDNMPLFQYIRDEYKCIDSYFDKIYVSYEIGSLKIDQPNSMFDYVLRDLEIPDFKNCLLIDDYEINCRNFKNRGGRTLLVG